MGLTTAAPFCNPVQSQTSKVCVTGTRSNSLGSRRLDPPMGGPACLHLCTSLATQKGSIQGDGPRLSQNDLDCTWLAQHALVLGPGQSVCLSETLNQTVYKSKWAVSVKWCKSNEVDFRSPSVTQIADFLLHLFKDRNLQPSTMEGYRTAIADMVDNDRLHISTDENLSQG